MEPRTIGSYGGPKVDALPVSNPESQVAASEMNRYMEDVAQGTRTIRRAAARFAAGVIDPVPPPLVVHRSVWGSGSAQKPVVNRTGVGRYTITYSPTFVDALGVSEAVAFFDCSVSVRTGDPADILDGKLLTIAANVVTVAVYSPVGVLADVGAVSGFPLLVTAWLL